MSNKQTVSKNQI